MRYLKTAEIEFDEAVVWYLARSRGAARHFGQEVKIVGIYSGRNYPLKNNDKPVRPEPFDFAQESLVEGPHRCKTCGSTSSPRTVLYLKQHVTSQSPT